MNLSKTFVLSQICVAATASSTIRGASQQRDLGADTRIIGGTEAIDGRYSYAVSLQDEIGHFCGGSLIAPDVVLSASHCTQEGDPYKAVIGRHNLNTADGDEIAVKTEIMHPGYSWGTTDNDYMILILERPVQMADVDLVQVDTGIVPVGAAVTVMGWGDTNEDPSIQTRSLELMETEVFVVSNEECEQSSGTVGGTNMFGWTIGGYEQDYHDQITENMMCAEDHGEDSCQGDSGGPLVIRSADGSADRQVGIVSWGVGCAEEEFPGIYSRISAQYEWIRQHVCNGSSAPPASFNCNNRVADTIYDAVTGGTGNIGSWTTIFEENFSNGLGLFGRNGNNARYYPDAMNRGGVIRIEDGEAGLSVLESNQLNLGNNPFTTFKINFSFYAIEMEHSDNLCLEYDVDNGAITGEKCWSSLHVFENDRWYDDESLVFFAPDARSLSIRFRVEGDDSVDDVLLDTVTIQGRVEL